MFTIAYKAEYKVESENVGFGCDKPILQTGFYYEPEPETPRGGFGRENVLFKQEIETKVVFEAKLEESKAVLNGFIFEITEFLEKSKKEVEFYRSQIIPYEPFYYDFSTNKYRKEDEFTFVFTNVENYDLLMVQLCSLQFEPIFYNGHLICKMKRSHKLGFTAEYVKEEVQRYLLSAFSYNMALEQIKWLWEMSALEGSLYKMYSHILMLNDNRNFCAPMALSIVMERPIEEINTFLIQEKLRDKRGGMITSKIFQVLDYFGFSRFDVTSVCRKEGKTVKTLGKILPRDRAYLIFTSHHCLAFRYGTIQDWTQNRLHRIQFVYLIEKKKGGFGTN